MNKLVNFQFNNVNIRTLTIDGQPWFVAKDVCNILKHTNSRQALKDLCEIEEVCKQYLPHPQNPNKTIEMQIVNESGLYALIFGSRLPAAKAFKRWVTSEVLPSIRKTGGYKIITKTHRNKINKKRIGLALRLYKDHDWSKADIGCLMDVNRRTVSAWTHGERRQKDIESLEHTKENNVGNLQKLAFVERFLASAPADTIEYHVPILHDMISSVVDDMYGV